jgi:xanthine dehydrogenase/oxidase
MQHAGEAIYCDDVPCARDELYLALVTSTRAHAKLLNVDANAALALPGVVAFFSARDLNPQDNKYGLIFQDEEVFASEKVIFFF